MADVAPDPTARPTVIDRGIATNLGLGGAAAALVPLVVDLVKDGHLSGANLRLMVIAGAALAAVAMVGRFWQAVEATKAKAAVAGGAPGEPGPPGAQGPMGAGLTPEQVDGRIREALETFEGALLAQREAPSTPAAAEAWTGPDAPPAFADLAGAAAVEEVAADEAAIAGTEPAQVAQVPPDVGQAASDGREPADDDVTADGVLA